MRCFYIVLLFVALTGCAGLGAQNPNMQNPNRQGPNARGPITAPNGAQQPIAPQGQYQRPAYMQAELPPRLPREDLCRSRLYLNLVGRHEGGITFAYLPVRTRVVKPAEQELDEDDFLQDMRPDPPFVEVREYIPGQVIYGPSIQAVRLADELGPVIEDRLTIELDKDGYVTALSCR